MTGMRYLGNLIDALDALDPSLAVEMDGETGLGIVPWRSDYSHASVCHGRTDYSTTSDLDTLDSFPPAETVGDLLAVARAVVGGLSLPGYKGWMWTLGRDAELWADEDGSSAGRFIADAKVDGRRLVLTIGERPSP